MDAALEETVLYKQIEEFAMNAAARIPGIRELNITVTEKGKINFTYQAVRIFEGVGEILDK